MLEFFKNIPYVVWVIAIVILVCAFYVTTTVKTVKKNQNRLLEIQKDVMVGSEVVLTSGIYGKVLSFDGVTMKLQVDENTILKVDRFAISKIFSKDEVKEQKKADKKLMAKAVENKEMLEKTVEEETVETNKE